MNKKLAIVAIVIVAIVVLAVGVFLAMQGGTGGNAPSASPSPTATLPGSTATPAPTGTSTATVTPTPGGNGGNVAGASSLQYSVTVTEGGETQGYIYRAKNMGTSQPLMLRIDYTDSSGELSIYIVNGVQQKAWTYSDQEWIDVSETYTAQYSAWSQIHLGYVGSLSGWTSGDWTYTAEGTTVRIYDVSVNPSLPDALFQPS